MYISFAGACALVGQALLLRLTVQSTRAVSSCPLLMHKTLNAFLVTVTHTVT